MMSVFIVRSKPYGELGFCFCFYIHLSLGITNFSFFSFFFFCRFCVCVCVGGSSCVSGWYPAVNMYLKTHGVVIVTGEHMH